MGYYQKEITIPKKLLFSDKNPLSSVMDSAKLNATVMRCVAELADYNFKVRYQPGKITQDCNYLSRYPIAETHTNEVDLEKVSTLFVNSCL